MTVRVIYVFQLHYKHSLIFGKNPFSFFFCFFDFIAKFVFLNFLFSAVRVVDREADGKLGDIQLSEWFFCKVVEAEL